MTLAIVNIGDSHDGGADGAPVPGDAIVVDGWACLLPVLPARALPER